jgi:hypothetical protein
MNGMRRLLVAVAIALFACPSLARAGDIPGTYVVSSCALGDQPIPLAGWYREIPGDWHLHDECGRPSGRFSAGPSGQEFWSSGERYRWLWDAPKDTVVAGLRAWGSSGSRDGIIGGLDAGGTSVSLATITPPAENLSLNTTRLVLLVACGNPEGCYAGGPPPDPHSGGSGGSASVSRIEILLRDVIAPEATGAPTGTLLNAGSLSGVVSVGTSYRDRGGGMQTLSLLVDGAPATQRVIADQSCRRPSAFPVPCPLAGQLDLDFDTTAISDGSHRVELELRDLAGNRTLVGPYPILVRNSPAVASPPKPGRLTLKRYEVRSKYGGRAVIEGTLADFGEAPLASAQIEVASRPLMRNAVFAPTAPAVTDANGHFTVAVPPGTSRTLRLRYASSEVSAEVVIPAPVKLKVSPGKTRNGKSVRFRGSIPGTDAGTRVELQARSGRRWVPFRTATLTNGRFSARYKFTSTTRTQRYKFRAVVRKDPNFPYAAGHSPAVSVLVRP